MSSGTHRCSLPRLLKSFEDLPDLVLGDTHARARILHGQASTLSHFPPHLFECPEDLPELVLRDAHARILHGQEDVLAILTDAPGDRDGSGARELG